jgi:hypothetical protein
LSSGPCLDVEGWRRESGGSKGSGSMNMERAYAAPGAPRSLDVAAARLCIYARSAIIGAPFTIMSIIGRSPHSDYRRLGRSSWSRRVHRVIRAAITRGDHDRIGGGGAPPPAAWVVLGIHALTKRIFPQLPVQRSHLEIPGLVQRAPASFARSWRTSSCFRRFLGSNCGSRAPARSHKYCVGLLDLQQQ